MNTAHFVPVHTLCTHYRLELTFFTGLNESGLVELIVVEEVPCIHEDHMADVEKMIRLHRDLQLNMEAIDVVWNLLQKIDALQEELDATKSRLGIYE